MKGVARLMTAVVLLGFVVLVTVDATGIAQEEKQVQQDKDQTKRAEAQKTDAKEIARIEKLVADLGDEEFAVRENAYKELKAIGEKARPWLKKALDSEDPEVRWRASRLLFLLDEEEVQSRNQRGRLTLRWPHDEEGSEERDLLQHFDDDMSSHLNELFGELFSDDFKPFFFRFGGDESINIDKLLDEFRRDTGELDIQLDGSTTKYMFQRTVNGEAVSLQLNIAPDGSVEARVTRTDAEGNEKTSTYSAANLDEFKKNYPEVVEEFQLDGFRVSIDLPELPGSNRLGLGLRLDRAPFGFAKKIQRKVLGVYTGDMSPALRAHLDLEQETGVLVTETAKGSFAAMIGIEPIDVIVSIKGKSVGSSDDIRKIMSSVEEGELVPVEVIRKGKRLKLEGKYDLK